MATNPINLALRFILELAALFVIGYWGWHQSNGILQYVLATGLPLGFAIIWGVFAVKDDPSRSGKTVVPTPGIIRLLIELSFFGLASFALFDLDMKTPAIVFSTFVLLHYAFSYDRISWLLQQ